MSPEKAAVWLSHHYDDTISVRRVMDFIRDGELAHSNIAPRGAKRKRWQITAEALESFVESRKVGKPKPAVRYRRALELDPAVRC